MGMSLGMLCTSLQCGVTMVSDSCGLLTKGVLYINRGVFYVAYRCIPPDMLPVGARKVIVRFAGVAGAPSEMPPVCWTDEFPPPLDQ